MPSPPLESHSGRFDGEFRGRRKRERERERGNERWDKGRDEPRNRDETNDNLSLKTLRAKSYGLVSPELYSPEFFLRFASRDRDTRNDTDIPVFLINVVAGNDEKYVSSKVSRRSWTKVRKNY